MKAYDGFTVVEVLVALTFLGLVSAITFDRYSNVQTVHRDQDRKTAINAIHYSLEEVVRPKLGGYPRVLTSSQLTAMDSALLTDPAGVRLGEPGSDYDYEPTGCNGGDLCNAYTIRADLELESDFIKSAPRN